ncbi:MAG: porin family protein [Chryseosolibacter sp.]
MLQYFGKVFYYCIDHSTMYRLLLYVFLFPAIGFAQTEFGIKAGLNISDIVMTNYVNPDVESGLRLKPGLHAGFFVNGTLKERIGLAAELLYSDKGVRANNTIHLHYIALPLLVQYQLREKIFAEIGPELGYMLSARSTLGDEGGTYNNKLDLALDAGVRFNTTKMVFDLRYCVGLFNVKEPFDGYNPPGVEKVKYQNRVLQLSVGYKLWILE